MHTCTRVYRPVRIRIQNVPVCTKLGADDVHTPANNTCTTIKVPVKVQLKFSCTFSLVLHFHSHSSMGNKHMKKDLKLCVHAHVRYVQLERYLVTHQNCHVPAVSVISRWLLFVPYHLKIHQPHQTCVLQHCPHPTILYILLYSASKQHGCFGHATSAVFLSV